MVLENFHNLVEQNIFFFSLININQFILINKNSEITTYTKKINTQYINNYKPNNR